MSVHLAASVEASPNVDVVSLAARAEAKGYSSICVPLTTPKWKERWTELCVQTAASERDVAAERRAEEWRANPTFLLDEVTLTSQDSIDSSVTILLSSWLELDSSDEWIRADAERALIQELTYASYLSITHAILPPPRTRTGIVHYARSIAHCLSSIPSMYLSVQLPPYDPTIFSTAKLAHLGEVSHSRTSVVAGHSGGDVMEPSTPKVVVSGESASTMSQERPSNDLDATWELWDVIRSVCDFNVRLSLALDLALPLPSVLGSLAKWTAEPVSYMFLPASAFLANNKGYPVLPKVTQAFLRNSMTHQPTIILSGVSKGQHVKGGETAYSQYVRHLEKTSPAVIASQKLGTVENYANGYQDFLQAPLQPLMDNLQSATYQTFEQDPVKYANYEEAMFRAFKDWPEEAEGERRIVCVAGAGRGPLVARCLIALERSKRQADVFCVEKNPSAFVTLQSRQKNEWGARVQLFYGDMRSVELPAKVDVLVSELLGSFGDNELSPECLDGAVRFLKPDGISIPSSYTAHIAPLSSSKLYNEARAASDEKYMETPYVVMLHAVNILSDDGQNVPPSQISSAPSERQCGGQIQECWEFEHPRRDPVLDSRGLPLTNSHNTRSARLRFHIPHAGLLHGLAGYFEAVLYGSVGLSIHPHRKDDISKDMLSWFPIFFPFKDPLYLPSNSELQVSIWRRTNSRQVWYEWHAESFLPIPRAISNADSAYSAHHTPTSQHTPHDSPSKSRTPGLLFGSPVPPPSPLIDASDPGSPAFGSNSANNFRKSTASDVSTVSGISMFGLPGSGGGSGSQQQEWSLVKIGQTSLHNQGGRSSWIGL